MVLGAMHGKSRHPRTVASRTQSRAPLGRVSTPPPLRATPAKMNSRPVLLIITGANGSELIKLLASDAAADELELAPSSVD